MASIDELLKDLPRLRRKKRIHERHKLSIGTATINSNINVTPLVDVVLVLLIIFMVVTPMITRGMPVEQPETKFHDRKNDSGEQVVVSITCNAPKMGPTRMECTSYSVFVGGDRVTDATIIDKVQQEMRKGTGNREIHIKADSRLNYSAVRETMEKIHNAGVASVALGSREKEKE